jgi:hypothetical protein
MGASPEGYLDKVAAASKLTAAKFAPVKNVLKIAPHLLAFDHPLFCVGRMETLQKGVCDKKDRSYILMHWHTSCASSVRLLTI